MPYLRGYLQDLNEVIHISVWLRRLGLTKESSRFFALERGSWIVTLSDLLRPEDYQTVDEKRFSFKEIMMQTESQWMVYDSCTNGRNCCKPLIDEERIVYADLDRKAVRQE